MLHCVTLLPLSPNVGGGGGTQNLRALKLHKLLQGWACGVILESALTLGEVQMASGVRNWYRFASVTVVTGGLSAVSRRSQVNLGRCLNWV